MNELADGVRELLLASGWSEITWEQAGESCLVCKHVNFRLRKWASQRERQSSKVYKAARVHYHMVVIDAFDSRHPEYVLLPFSRDKMAIDVAQKFDIDWGELARQVEGSVCMSAPPTHASKMSDSGAVLYALLHVHQKWIKTLELNSLVVTADAVRCIYEQSVKTTVEVNHE